MRNLNKLLNTLRREFPTHTFTFMESDCEMSEDHGVDIFNSDGTESLVNLSVNIACTRINVCAWTSAARDEYFHGQTRRVTDVAGIIADLRLRFLMESRVS